MADRIGTVYYGARIVGEDMPRDAKRIGREAGAAMGKEMGDSFDKEFSKRYSRLANDLIPDMRRNGRLWGTSISDAMSNRIRSGLDGLSHDIADAFVTPQSLQDFLQSGENVNQKLTEMRGKLKEAREAGLLNDEMWNRFGGTLNQAAGSARKTEEALADKNKTLDETTDKLGNATGAKTRFTSANERLAGSVRRSNDAMKRKNNTMSFLQKRIHGLRSSWLRMDSTVRLVILSILLLGREVAALGSAAGGSLAILVGALASGALGIGVFIAAVKNLGKDISELPEGLHGAATAFQGFTASLGAMQDKIELAAAGGMERAFSSLKLTVDALGPSMEAVATLVGDAFARMAESLAPGTAGFEKLQSFITGSLPIIDLLMSAVQNLGGGMGALFTGLQPSIQAFAEWLDRILGQFNEWASSVGGQSAIAQWGENTLVIMAAVGDVFAATGKALADLSSQGAMDSLVSFLGQLADFMPVLGGILEVIGHLGLLSILGALFETLGAALAPVMPLLIETASILGGAIVGAIQAVAPLIASLVAAIVPLLPPIAELIASLVPPLARLFETLAPIIMRVVEALMPLITAILDALMPILTPLLDLLGILLMVGLEPLVLVFQVLGLAIMAMTPIWTFLGELIGAVIGTIVALFEGDFQKVGQIWLDLWNGLPQPLQDFITNTIGMFVDFFTNTVGMFSDFFNNTIGMFTDFWNNTTGMFSDFGNNLANAWNALWGGFSDTVGSIWNGIVGFVEDGVNNVISIIRGMLRGINSVTSNFGISIPLPSFVNFARGGLITQETFARIGEAGREMVVPLDRPVSTVDPAVRDVAAYAQGLGGKDSGTTKNVTVEAGAIVIRTAARNPETVANMVLDGVLERALN